MGFGTYFIGYFLILNFAFYGFTDAIAAAIMLLGLYKLSSVNREFRVAAIIAAIFLMLGCFELGSELYVSLFSGKLSPALTSTVAILRHALIAATTVAALAGIRSVADEVGIPTLSKRAARLAYVTPVVYVLLILLETPLPSLEFLVHAAAVIALLALLFSLALIIANLSTIYSAYMQICMPEDLEMNEPSSKFGFVNAMRRHEEEKQREYREYRLERLRQKNAKKTKNKDKK